jgi:outer membrane protein OmpA-like peptidoglycan-associated protein
LIFFARGSVEPLASSKRALDDFVFEGCHDKVTVVEIQGNIDASDVGQDNGSLGRKRALAVRQLLLESGLHADAFHIVDFGSHRPLVPTSADVAEPQNRRVALIKNPAPQR